MKTSMRYNAIQISKRLYKLYKAGEFRLAQLELFAEDVVRIEIDEVQGKKEYRGVDSVLENEKRYMESIEAVFSGHVSKPKVFSNSIFIEIAIDVKMKSRERESYSRMCRYEVQYGKIIMEEIYYPAGIKPVMA